MLNSQDMAWPCWPSHILCLPLPTCLRFLTNSIACKKVHMKCLTLTWWPDLCQHSLENHLVCLYLTEALYLSLHWLSGVPL